MYCELFTIRSGRIEGTSKPAATHGPRATSHDRLLERFSEPASGRDQTRHRSKTTKNSGVRIVACRWLLIIAIRSLRRRCGFARREATVNRSAGTVAEHPPS